MSGFIKGEDRHQATLFPERLAPDQQISLTDPDELKSFS
jgi:hypothetical protein